jgi:hypothetical protein
MEDGHHLISSLKVLDGFAILERGITALEKNDLGGGTKTKSSKEGG